jgi:hypothetical protein
VTATNVEGRHPNRFTALAAPDPYVGLHHALGADGFAALAARQPRFGVGMPVAVLRSLVIQIFMLWLVHAHAKLTDILAI